jgi:PAS domain S-box-containing protein
MTKTQDGPVDAAELRRRAEGRLKRQRPADGGQTTAVDTARLVHELQVHQIELEMQNEELKTSRTEVEAGLALYADLYDGAPTGYLTLDSEGAIRRVNVTGARLFGIERSRLVNRRVGLFVAEGDRRTFSDFLQRVFASQATECCEVTLPQDGAQALLVQIEGTRSGDGQECRAVVLDITQRKRAEETVRESERRYRELFDQGNEGLLIMTLDGRLSEVNRAFAQMHGYNAEAFKGTDIQALDVLHERTLEDRADVTRRVQAGEVVRFEVEHHHKDGHIFPLSVTMSIVDLAGQMRYLAFHQDITERKLAEEKKATLEAQLRQAQKMESVGRLAGGVAHDFNNMLGVILGHTELALMDLDPAQPLHDDLLAIRSAANRSADLTRHLLAFARKQTVSPKVLDLNETVPAMLQMLRRLIGEDIDLTWQPGADLWSVRVDPSQIDQILANLCVNARDAIAGVGKVTIETETTTFDDAYCALHPGSVPGQYVRLSVSDDGGGMDKDTLSHLFEPFFTTKVMGKGTGLGLSTVYGIVKQNNGFIYVDSTPGQGTTFTIYLPRHEGKGEQARTERVTESASRGHETILLVEDEPAILVVTTRMLTHQGYHVLAANTPGKAIRLAREYAGEIQLLLTDVIMPEMNGRVLGKRLLSLHPHLKTLFMSGYTANIIADHGVVEEGVSFIQKPFSVTDLAVKVRETLDSE